MDFCYKVQKVQNVLQCYYCEILDLFMYCEICKMYMCDICSEKLYFLNIMIEYRVVLVKKWEKIFKSKEYL